MSSMIDVKTNKQLALIAVSYCSMMLVLNPLTVRGRKGLKRPTGSVFGTVITLVRLL